MFKSENKEELSPRLAERKLQASSIREANPLFAEQGEGEKDRMRWGGHFHGLNDPGITKSHRIPRTQRAETLTVASHEAAPVSVI